MSSVEAKCRFQVFASVNSPQPMLIEPFIPANFEGVVRNIWQGAGQSQPRVPDMAFVLDPFVRWELYVPHNRVLAKKAAWAKYPGKRTYEKVASIRFKKMVHLALYSDSHFLLARP